MNGKRKSDELKAEIFRLEGVKTCTCRGQWVSFQEIAASSFKIALIGANCQIGCEKRSSGLVKNVVSILRGGNMIYMCITFWVEVLTVLNT